MPFIAGSIAFLLVAIFIGAMLFLRSGRPRATPTLDATAFARLLLTEIVMSFPRDVATAKESHVATPPLREELLRARSMYATRFSADDPAAEKLDAQCRLIIGCPLPS